MQWAKQIRRALASIAIACGAFTNTATAQSTDNIFQGAFDEPELAHMAREWAFYDASRDIDDPEPPISEPEDRDLCLAQECEAIFDVSYIGRPFFYPPESESRAIAEVFSNETGKTYYASAAAPNDGMTSDETILSGTYFRQVQYYRRTDQSASLKLIITAADLETSDFNNNYEGGCPSPEYDPTIDNISECGDLLKAVIRFYVTVTPALLNRRMNPDFPVYKVGGFALLSGRRGDWNFSALPGLSSDKVLWFTERFDFDPAVDDSDGRAKASLPTPYPVTIPLDDYNVGEVLRVDVELEVEGSNKLRGETYAGAYFRDPLDTGGVELETIGFEPAEGLVGYFPDFKSSGQGECFGPPDPNAGEIGFSVANVEVVESPTNNALIEITRTGGNVGPVSARVRTLSGTAGLEQDFQLLDTVVQFNDGDDNTRWAEVKIVHDNVEEPSETLIVELSDPRGCSTLGDQTQVVVTIKDDDRVPDEPDQFTVGGTIAGVLGAGLRVGLGFSEVLEAANGLFTFNTLFDDSEDYSVDIVEHPSDPAQACIIDNDSGQIQAANVTNVQVTCSTPALSSALDDTFGADGRVTGELGGGAVGASPQSDGRLVVAGSVAVRRFLEDGQLDTSFGEDGQALLGSFAPGRIEAMAIQADDKIVVVGEWTRDFFVARFDADGTLDDTFGTAGVSIADFEGGYDIAEDVAIQSDGKIVAAGLATATENDFAAARFTSNGDLDSTFGGDGLVVVDIAGGGDLGYAVAVQSDGAIVLAGRVGLTGTSEPDIALVRLTASGALDTSFATGGVMRDETPGIYEEIYDLLIQPDGKMVVAGARSAAKTSMEIARYNSDGSVDTDFGAAGRTTDIGFGEDESALALAIQSDSKLLVAGFVRDVNYSSDFAVGRLLTDGTVDSSFGEDGRVRIDFFGEDDFALALTLDDSGNAIVAGSASNARLRQLGIARLNP